MEIYSRELDLFFNSAKDEICFATIKGKEYVRIDISRMYSLGITELIPIIFKSLEFAKYECSVKKEREMIYLEIVWRDMFYKK